MSFWDRLFRKKAAAPVQRPSAVTPARTTVSSATPKSPPILPGWAQDLKEKRDYAALAAITYNSRDPQWSEKKGVAERILKQAGGDAVDAMLREISSQPYCNIYLADVLVDIGDPRAVPVLKKQLLAGGFKAYGSESTIARFVTKFDPSVEEERRLAKEKEDAVADARLTAPPVQGVQLREYATAYIFQPAASAKRAYNALQAATRAGKAFPLAAPYQVGLVHGPAADFIAVLVRLPTPNDESVALNRRIKTWFAETGAGAFDDYETLTAPLPGRLSRGLRFLANEYSVLEIIDKL
jgi:hypothetical protein